MICETSSNQAKVNKRKSEAFVCDICSVEVSSLDVLECHKKGQKHAKKLRQLAEIQSIKPVQPEEIKSIEPTISTEEASPINHKNSLQLLFEFSTKNKIKLTYDVIKETGPSHNRIFEVKCSLNDLATNNLIRETTAVGTSISRAKHSAAELMLKEANSLDEYTSLHKKINSNNSAKKKTLNKRANSVFGAGSNTLNLNDYEELISTHNKRLILAKNALIQANSQQLNLIDRVLTQIETSLKKISDKLLANELTRLDCQPENSESYRELESVVRVDTLAKDTLIGTDRHFCLVVILKSLPTLNLIKQIGSEFNLLLGVCDDSTIKFSLIDENECLTLKCESAENLDDSYYFKLMFTSMLVTNMTNANEETKDAISLDLCRNALTLVMRIRWFNIKLKPISNSVLILRLLRDLCHRSPTWSVLNDWLLELLVDKCFFRNKYEEITHKFRSFFELISSGGLFLNSLSIRVNSLNDHAGDDALCLIDPCTNNDAFDQVLTQQQKEDLTSSAQHALRLISFNRIKEVLAID